MKQFLKIIVIGVFLAGGLVGQEVQEEEFHKEFMEKMKALEKNIKFEIKNRSKAAQLYLHFAQENKFPINRQYELQRMRGELLLLAATFGHAEVVEILLEHGIPVDVATYFGKTALFYAIEYGHMHVAKLLLDYGADMYKQNKYNETPLGLAAKIPQFANLFQMYATKSTN